MFFNGNLNSRLKSDSISDSKTQTNSKLTSFYFSLNLISAKLNNEIKLTHCCNQLELFQ
jgi:hypothetical protein